MFSLQQFRKLNLKVQLAFLIETGLDLETECKIGPTTYCLFQFHNYYAEILYDHAGKPVRINCFMDTKGLDKYMTNFDTAFLRELFTGEKKSNS